LKRLVAGECAERVDERLGVDQRPQLLGAALGEGVLDRYRATQAHDVGCRVPASNALPPRVLRPLAFEGGGLLLTGALRHVVTPVAEELLLSNKTTLDCNPFVL
jgi:hypothetical protein